MNYTGKLYGKVNRTYIPLIMTSDDVDRLERELNQARQERDELKEALQLVWKHLKGERIRHDYITGTSEAGDLKTLQQVCEEALTAKKGGSDE